MDRKINATAFKAKCLALIDEVAESGQPITVTKRGKAKVQIVAVREKPKTSAPPGTFKIIGDIVGPLDEEYDEDREWRNIIGQFDDPPARYTHNRLADRKSAKPRKGRQPRVRRSTRGK